MLAFLITAASIRFVRFLNLSKSVLVISLAIKKMFNTVAVYGLLLFLTVFVLALGGKLVDLFSLFRNLSLLEVLLI